MVKMFEKKNVEINKTEKSNEITLIQYLDRISKVIEVNCGSSQWVRCEIVNINKSGQHYYLEISDTDQNGNKIKGKSAVIFSSNVFNVINKFENHTKMKLASGMNVLLLMKVSFTSNFGMSLIVEGIDPSFTIGEIERKNNLIIDEIYKRGWNNLNKQKDIPYHFKKIAVLSPSGAAGLGDFKSESDRMSRFGFCEFDYYEAKFEGSDVVESITKQMELIFNGGNHDYDALVFIRGGGSVSSLQYLNEFKIVSYIAKYPIPVLVGVGHERDYVIIDDFAKIKFDTPSKVAEFIFNYNYKNFIETEKNITYIFNQIDAASNHYIYNTKSNVEQIFQYSLRRVDNYLNQTLNSRTFIDNKIQQEISQKINYVDTSLQTINNAIINKYNEIEFRLKSSMDGIYMGSMNLLNKIDYKVKSNFEFIETNSYERVLEKGYSIIRQGEKIVTSKEDFDYKKGLSIVFSDGIIEYK